MSVGHLRALTNSQLVGGRRSCAHSDGNPVRILEAIRWPHQVPFVRQANVILEKGDRRRAANRERASQYHQTLGFAPSQRLDVIASNVDINTLSQGLRARACQLLEDMQSRGIVLDVIAYSAAIFTLSIGSEEIARWDGELFGTGFPAPRLDYL